MTEEEFREWLRSARPGERVEYHRGYLPKASAHLPLPERLRLRELAKTAREAAERGDVLLVQRRHGDYDYVYIAVRSGRASLRRIAA